MTVRTQSKNEKSWASQTYWIYDPKLLNDPIVVTSYTSGRYQTQPNVSPYDFLGREIRTSVETVLHEDHFVKHHLSVEFTTGLGPITVYYRIYRRLYLTDRRW